MHTRVKLRIHYFDFFCWSWGKKSPMLCLPPLHLYTILQPEQFYKLSKNGKKLMRHDSCCPWYENWATKVFSTQCKNLTIFLPRCTILRENNFDGAMWMKIVEKPVVMPILTQFWFHVKSKQKISEIFTLCTSSSWRWLWCRTFFEAKGGFNQKDTSI